MTYEENIDSGKWLMVGEMAYTNGRPSSSDSVVYRVESGYDLFARGSNVDFSRAKWGNPIVISIQSKFHSFPYWASDFFEGRDLLFDLEYG